MINNQYNVQQLNLLLIALKIKPIDSSSNNNSLMTT